MDILEVIELKSEELTKKQRMIAKYMTKNPNKMAYITLKDLSKEIGVTQITILNTCQSLGYEGFNDVKYEFRKASIINEKMDVFEEKDEYGVGIPDYECNKGIKMLEEIGTEEIKMVSAFWSHINLDTIFEAARMIRAFQKIFVCGRGVSYYLAEFLSKRMMGCDVFSVCVNTELNDDAYGVMECIDEKTLILAISFPDYYFMTEKMAEYAKKRKATVLAITDTKEAMVAKVSDFTLTVPTMTRVFLNTLTAPMLLMNLLTSAIKLDAKPLEINGDK